MLLNFAQHSKKSKRKACDNRVAIAWVSLILEVETHHKSKKNGLRNLSWRFLAFFRSEGRLVKHSNH